MKKICCAITLSATGSFIDNWEAIGQAAADQSERPPSHHQFIHDHSH
ncbi:MULTISPECIES: hypothetical protein [Hymenobacter]|nr:MULTISPECIES: hypothetical protein [Hymenobacter]